MKRHVRLNKRFSNYENISLYFIRSLILVVPNLQYNGPEDKMSKIPDTQNICDPEPIERDDVSLTGVRRDFLDTTHSCGVGRPL